MFQSLRRVSGRLVFVLLIALGGGLSAPSVAAEDEDESRFLSRIRRLTVEGRRAGEGYFSPDGKEMVFQSEREPGNPFFQIYLLSLETGDTRRVSPGQGKTTCAFISGKNGDILFASTHLDPRSLELQQAEIDFRESGQERRYEWDYDSHMDIFVERRSDGRLVRLTDAQGYDAEGSWSPDGEWIVFTSMRDMFDRELSDRESRLAEIDPLLFRRDLHHARGRERTAAAHRRRRLRRRSLLLSGRVAGSSGAVFSEDGLIAEIWSMEPDGADQRQLTDFGAMSWAPYVHPSGEYVLFASNKLGFSNFEVYMVDVAGRKEPVRITTTDGFDGLPVPTPDGAGLAWTSSRHGEAGGQIYLADWNHEEARAALREAPVRAGGGETPE